MKKVGFNIGTLIVCMGLSFFAGFTILSLIAHPIGTMIAAGALLYIPCIYKTYKEEKEEAEKRWKN